MALSKAEMSFPVKKALPKFATSEAVARCRPYLPPFHKVFDWQRAAIERYLCVARIARIQAQAFPIWSAPIFEAMLFLT